MGVRDERLINLAETMAREAMRGDDLFTKLLPAEVLGLIEIIRRQANELAAKDAAIGEALEACGWCFSSPEYEQGLSRAADGVSVWDGESGEWR